MPRFDRELVLARFAAAPASGRRGSLAPAAPIREWRGDHNLNPDMMPQGWGEGRALTPAAVLVGLAERPEGLTVLLTRRSERLADHAGQVGFPGGRVDAGDADALATALREAEEEIGLEPERVRPIGRLDTYIVRTGFEVTPIVALVDPPPAFQPDPIEVDEVFEVPLEVAADRARYERRSRLYQGRRRHFYVLPWRDYHIWGATAGMLVNLAEILTDER
jgi:8-oxo-dGTP pyrophosphatase MutT (NUDIX family)